MLSVIVDNNFRGKTAMPVIILSEGVLHFDMTNVTYTRPVDGAIDFAEVISQLTHSSLNEDMVRGFFKGLIEKSAKATRTLSKTSTTKNA